MLRTTIQSQQDFIAKLRKDLIPCPNCGTPFCAEDNQVGRKALELYQCPECGLFWREGLSLMGDRFWIIERNMTRVEEALESLGVTA